MARPVRWWARNRFNSSAVTAPVNKRRQLPAIAGELSCAGLLNRREKSCVPFFTRQN